MAADLAATVGALQAQLRSLKCPLRLDASAAETGSPAPYLQALSWLLLHFSKHVALLVTQQGLQLRGTTDLRFAEGALRFARDVLTLRPALSAAQLLADGQFARAKAALVLDVARACKDRHNTAARQERLAALKACHAEQRLYSAAPPTSAAAPQAEQQRQQQQQAGRPTIRSAIPRPPPPHVRVVSAAAQQQAAAAGGTGYCAAPVPGRAEEELGSEDSEGGVAPDAATTPTSVVAAADASAQGKQQPASQPLPAAQRPAASPADQPRALPPVLLAARPAEVQQPAGPLVWVGGSGDTRPCVLPLTGYPQLLEAAPSSRLSALAVLPQQLLQQQPQQAQQLQQAQQTQPAQQLQQAQQAQTHSIAVAQAATSLRGSGSLAEQQTQRLIEDLQLRLELAEETATAARHEAQAAREQLQARVTILEGRVRFLEAGFELRPPHQPQPLLLAGTAYGLGQAQPPLALPAPASTGASVGMGPALGAGSSGGSFGGSFGGGVGGTAAWGGGVPLAASSAPWQPPQPEQPLQASLHQHARANPLFESQQPEAAPCAPAAPRWQAAEAAVPRALPTGVALASSSRTACQLARQPASQVAEQLAWRQSQVPPAATLQLVAAVNAPPAATLAAGDLSSGCAAELIRSMQARFSEADDFLLSLRRL